MSNRDRSDLVYTSAWPEVVAVETSSRIPRFWVVAWLSGLNGKALAFNTLRPRLRHVGALYRFCDQHFGEKSLDEAISNLDAATLQRQLEHFHLHLTAEDAPSSETKQRWDAAKTFLLDVLAHFSVADESVARLRSFIRNIKVRKSRKKGIKFGRALPSRTLFELLEIARPDSPRNPFLGESTRWRNWLIVNLLLLLGLRRGELLLLTIDALKQDVDPETGQLVCWLDVTTVDDEDERSTKPSIKTETSHRQIPVSEEISELYERYVTDFREQSDSHPFLMTARGGSALSAESVNAMLASMSSELGRDATDQFSKRTGGKKRISPHDLRHTCATAMFRAFLKVDNNRELSMQRMRAFFGWSADSDMPEHYARSAINDDLLKTWRTLFQRQLDQIIGLST
ncbi:MAG: tyrosine-type recombinase/integrase [Betaproteobacteria bacterium]|jgi:integrase|nr:tyrosine-type recombinase/integrase [Rubrivivax sp.]